MSGGIVSAGVGEVLACARGGAGWTTGHVCTDLAALHREIDAQRARAEAAERALAEARAAILEDRAAKLHDQRMAAALRGAPSYEAQAEARQHKRESLQRVRRARAALLALAAAPVVAPSEARTTGGG